ncbi:MAG: hemolytic protein HlpA-like protein [Salinisphaeraceae bacterium]|nr:hemolytic protein HlpA-like protein [Salinisphaeraceae bacterium]
MTTTVKSPLVLVIFNRPEPLARVVKALERHHFEQIYLIADGPRASQPDDAPLCDAVRTLAGGLKTHADRVVPLFSEHNMGCSSRVRSGLDQVFSQVDRAIILEDDCLPGEGLFRFMDGLLDRFEHDERVYQISGGNRGLPGRLFSHDYAFSRYPLCWGWATWRRAWQQYRHDCSDWERLCADQWPGHSRAERRARKYWAGRYRSTGSQRVDAWDFPWQLTLWRNNGLAVLPRANMVRNIGFGDQGTHTKAPPLDDLRLKLPAFPLNHPPRTMRDDQLDNYLQQRIYDPTGLPKRWRRVKALYRSMVEGADN